MEKLPVQGAPNFYQCHEGVLDGLPEVLDRNHLSRGLLIHGKKSWEAAHTFFDELALNTLPVEYNGECTHIEVERISSVIADGEPDYILGVGGGKVMDITKAVADATGRPYILVPTLASNCAPWTPLSVFYDATGSFITHTVFPKNALAVLVEPEIIINAPVGYLTAGIGDTIAKWYEADVLIRGLEVKPLAVEIAHHAAGLCRDVLLSEGKDAVTAVLEKTVTASFLRVVETIIMAGGMVGGFGERYGRIAGAHSIHNGLTGLAETHTFLHGDKVAYGVLVQLALEGNYGEIKRLLPFYEELNLPKSLLELGISSGAKNVSHAIQVTAEASTKQGESIHFMSGVVDPLSVSVIKGTVIVAMEELERFVSGEG